MIPILGTQPLYTLIKLWAFEKFKIHFKILFDKSCMLVNDIFLLLDELGEVSHEHMSPSKSISKVFHFNPLFPSREPNS